MRITDISIRTIVKRSENPPWNPRTVWREKNVVLVIVETDQGIAGLGEAWCEGGAPETIVTLIERDLRPMLLGQDAHLRNRLWEQCFQRLIPSGKHGIVLAALSAIDIALWDIVGKEARLPLYKLLGGGSDRVFAYASGGLYAEGKGPAELAREMAGYVQQGFRAVKLKIGGAPLKADIARVAAVREAVGEDVRLMVDAVYSLSVEQALRMAKALEPYDVYFLEAPVSPYNVKGLARVSNRSAVPVAGNEFAAGRWAFRDLIEHGAVSYLHLDAILCGGIGEAMRIASTAASHELPCSFHSSSSAVCFAANLHVAAAIPNCDSIEYHMVHRLLFDEVPEGTFALEDGWVRLPDEPGLGVQLTL